MKKFLIMMLIFGGLFLHAKNNKIIKVNNVFLVIETKTYYQAKLIWGDNWVDHDNNTSVHGTKVVAFGDGWEYSTTTDDTGVFKVEVEADSPFRIKASDGNSWSMYEEDIKGIALGTILND